METFAYFGRANFNPKQAMFIGSHLLTLQMNYNLNVNHLSSVFVTFRG